VPDADARCGSARRTPSAPAAVRVLSPQRLGGIVSASAGRVAAKRALLACHILTIEGRGSSVVAASHRLIGRHGVQMAQGFGADALIALVCYQRLVPSSSSEKSEFAQEFARRRTSSRTTTNRTVQDGELIDEWLSPDAGPGLWNLGFSCGGVMEGGVTHVWVQK